LSIGTRGDEDVDDVARHVASVAPCPDLIRAIASCGGTLCQAPERWLHSADAHALEDLLEALLGAWEKIN